jgi:molybdopterin/thiamine biosynthesis adenylyltransferase
MIIIINIKLIIIIIMSTDRFDRQNRVYGIEGTQKIQSATVAIVGPISDLTYEIAKDLALSGINNIILNLSILDNVDTLDTFCPGQIHKCSVKTMIDEIKKLNPYLTIIITDQIDDLTNTIIVFVNPSKRYLNLIKNLDQSNKIICFSALDNSINITETNITTNKTISYRFINDFKNHLVTDIDGENYELITIGEIKSNSITKTYDIKTTSNHNLDWGSLVNFKLCSSNNEQIDFCVKIKSVINSNTFSIESKLESVIDSALANFKNGYMCRQKEHIILNHKSIDEVLNENNWTESLLNNKLDICELSPLMQYYMGALIASEVIKGITSKYLPSNQTMELEYSGEISFLPSNQTMEKLANLKCFIVGSGAIGCELLKNLVAINTSTSTDSYIKITDPDHIEVSNLSRQFLFRSENVGKSKSKTASDRIKVFNPLTNIISYEEKLSLSNQNFTNNHFPQTDIVFNALDNFSARLYVDSQCVKFQKPLFESGTLGTKGNTQAIIPYITESYGASQDSEQENSFPACTIKNFPTLIQHTIHWAMDDFDGLFVKQPQMLKQYLEAVKTNNYTYLESIPSNEQNVIKNNLKILLTKLNTIKSTNDYIRWAVEIYMERFCNRINRLLKTHPIDYMVDNKLFWSNGKKCPKVLKLDISNETAYNFIDSTTKLLAETFNVLNLNDIVKTTNLDKLLELIDIAETNTTYCDDPDLYEDLELYPHENLLDKQSLLDNITSMNIIINPQEFEKDNDLNNHILFVQSDSNSRAQNYDIPLSNFYETKGIAGKIIPALATTTSIVASLITMEMIKYISNKDRPIEDYMSTFINLASNFIIQSEPIATTIKEINGMKLTEWGQVPSIDGTTSNNIKFESDKSMLLSDFIKYWSEKFNNEITMVCIGSKILFMSGSKESNLDKTLNELINGENGEYDISLFLSTDDDSIDLPEIKVI